MNEDWPPLDIPDWVPEGARRFFLWYERSLLPQPGRLATGAALWHSSLSTDTFAALRGKALPQHERVRRLATAREMGRVWQELKSKRHGASDDQLYRFTFSACELAFAPLSVLTAEDYEQALKQFESAASLCLSHQPVAQNPEHAAALEQAAKYFDALAEKSRRWKPTLLFVKNHTKDDEARAYVVLLGNVTNRLLFGTTAYSTVATTASVALDREVTPRQARGWCEEADKLFRGMPVLITK